MKSITECIKLVLEDKKPPLTKTQKRIRAGLVLGGGLGLLATKWVGIPKVIKSLRNDN